MAAFAIAFSVALIGGRLVGGLFLAGATIIAVTRVFVGLHYAGDVAGGAVIGFVSALIIFLVADSRWVPLVRILSRLTDPLVTPVWNALDEFKLRRRARSSRTG